MLTKEHVDKAIAAGHAFVEELGALFYLQLQGGAAQGQQNFQGPGAAQQAQQGQATQQFQQAAPQGQFVNQGAPQGQQMQQAAPQQQQGGAITSDTIMQLLHTPVAPGKPNLVDDPAARPLLQQALQGLGIGSLPDAKPEQYPALYAAFQGVVAQLSGQGQQMQQGFQQQPQGGFQQGQQPQGQFQQNPQQGYQQQPQQGYQQNFQQQPQGGYNPQQGGGLV